MDSFANIATGLRLQSARERLEGRLDVSGWKGTPSFATFDIGGIARSTTARRGQVFVARAGLSVASAFTPADIWFGGDTGRARPVLLRAHPVISDGELRVEQIGRQIVYTSGEVQRWWRGRHACQVGAAAFVDVAQVDRRVAPDARTDVDVGIGARLALPGLSGMLRIDVAKGLRDGSTALSFVYDP